MSALLVESPLDSEFTPLPVLYCLIDMSSSSHSRYSTALGFQAYSSFQPVVGRSNNDHDQSAEQPQSWPTSFDGSFFGVTPQQVDHTQIPPSARSQNTSRSMAVQDYNDPMEYRDRQEYQSLAPTITSPDLSPALGASAINPIIIGEDVSVGTRVVVYRGHRTIIDRDNYSGPLGCGWRDCTYAGAFTSLPGLWRHIQSIHLSPEEYICSHCSSTFGLGREDRYRKHLRDIHGDDNSWRGRCVVRPLT